MKIIRKELLKILNSIKYAVDNNNIIDDFKNIIIDNNKIIAYNDRIFIYHIFETNINQVSISFNEFHKIISNLKNDEIDLNLNNDKLVIKSNNIIANFNINSSINISEIIKRDELEFKNLPDDFIDGLSLCSFSASNDSIRMDLTGIKISGNKIVSSDNRRLSEYKMSESFDNDFLIPNDSVKELIKFKNINQYCLIDNCIYFKNQNGLIFGSLLLNESYSDYTKILEVDGIKLKLPLNKLKENIKLSSIFINEQYILNEKINIEIDNNKLICKSSGSKGNLESIIDIDGNYRCLKFSIHPQFFYQVLDKLEIKNIVLSDNKILLEADNFKHVICLF